MPDDNGAQQGRQADIGAPWTAGIAAVNTPDGPRVVLSLFHVTGTTVVGMAPEGAKLLGNEILRKSREARFGLKVIGAAGGDEEEGEPE